MKKRLAAAAVLILVVFTLSGCFPTGEKDPNTTSSVDFAESDTYEYNKDYLEVSFKLPDIPSGVPMRIKLKEKNFDPEEIIGLFFGGKTILEDKTWEGNYHADDKSHLLTDPERNVIRFNDGKTAPVPRDPIDVPVNYQTPVLHLKEYFKEEYYPNGELEEFPSGDAIKRALELTSTIGITNLGEPEVFAVTLDSYEKFKEHYNDDIFFNDDLPMTKENEIYYLTFQKVYDGIELADISSLSIKDNTDGLTSTISSPTVTVGVSRDNIFLFDSGATYEDEFEVLSDKPVKYDLNYALNELENYLEKVFFSSRKSAKINTAKLIYLPIEMNADGTVECVLAWSFEGYIGDINDDFNWNDYKIIIRADDGTRFVVEK